GFVIVEGVRGRIGGGEDLEVKFIEERAGKIVGFGKLFLDGVEIVIGGFLREALLETEEFLKGVVEPEARRRAAEEIVMLSKDAPDLARVFDYGLAEAQVVHGNALAVKHAEDVVIRLNEKRSGIGERFILCEPRSLSVTVRADKRQFRNLRVKRAGDFSRSRVGRKEAVFVDEHGCDSSS